MNRLCRVESCVPRSRPTRTTRNDVHTLYSADRHSSPPALRVRRRDRHRRSWADFGLCLIALLLLGSLAAQAAEPGVPAVPDRAISLGTIDLQQAANALHPAGLLSTTARPLQKPFVLTAQHPLPVPSSAQSKAKSSQAASGWQAKGSLVGGLIGLAAVDPSPAPTISFTAVEDDGTSAVPDSSGAVGPEHVLTVLNSQIRVQDRSGNILASLTLDAFFSNFGSDIFTYDPRCLFDPYGGRWIVTAAANPASLSAGVVLAVSAGPDPTGDWFRYYFDINAGNQTFADSPVVGFNRHWIGIQANLHHQLTGDFVASQILAVDRTNVYAGGSGLFGRITLDGDTYGGSQIPATTFDTDQPNLHFVKNWAGYVKDPQSGLYEGWLRVFTLSGPLGSEVVTPGSFITTGVEIQNPPFVWADFPTGNQDLGKQSGSSRKIFLGDARIQSVAYRGGTLWCSQRVLLPATSPTRSAVQWWEIYPDGRLFQRHLIDDASGRWSYAYPTLAVNNHYDVLLGYNGFSSTVFPSAYYRLYPNGGVYNSPRDEQRLQAGLGSYVEDYLGNNRWGDWSTTCVDPLNDGIFWTLQESSLAPTPADPGRWQVTWGSIAPDHALQLTVNASSPGVVVGQPFTWTLTISNRLLSFAYQTLVRMPIPIGFQPESAVCSTGNATITNGSLLWSIPRVGVESNRCEFRGTITGVTTQLIAQASAEAAGESGLRTNQQARVLVPFLNQPPVIPPALDSRQDPATGNWLLEWPVGYLGFHLESADDLNSASWSLVSGTPNPQGTIQRVTVTPTAQARFFRLRR